MQTLSITGCAVSNTVSTKSTNVLSKVIQIGVRNGHELNVNFENVGLNESGLLRVRTMAG